MSIAFTGMASGLDTDSIVEALLATQQSKIDTQYQKQKSTEYKVTAWKAMNEKIDSFYSLVKDMSLKGNYPGNSVTSTSSAVSVSASSTASTGNHSFTVSQLASVASVSTSSIGVKIDKDALDKITLEKLGVTSKTAIQIIREGEGERAMATETIWIDPKDTLKTLSDKLGEDISIGVDDKSGKLIFDTNSSKVTLEGGVLKKLGMASSTITIGQGQSKIAEKVAGTITSNSEIGALVGFKDNKLSKVLTINGEDIEISANDSVGTVISNIQKKLSKELNVSFDETTSSFLISSKETGESAFVSISGDEDVLNALGLQSGINFGQNAMYSYNGKELEAESNNVSINGLNVTFNSETTEAANVTVSKDTKGLVSYITKFVDVYNSLIEDISSALNATKSGYNPYSESEEEEATDEQIEKRENTLIKEALKGDSTLKSIRDNLRSSLQGIVYVGDEAYGLSSIGITTGNYTENGKLYVNEKDLTAALEKNPDAVINLFTQVEDTSGTTTDEVRKKVNKTGLITSMKSYLYNSQTTQNYRSFGKFYSDKSMDDSIKSTKDRIKELKERYTSMQSMYQAKFTAMETALSKLNSQQSALSSYLS